MNQTLRSLAAGATGALVMAAIVLGNSVTGAKVSDGTLTMDDLATATGSVAYNPPSLAAGQCTTTLIPTGEVNVGDFVSVQPDFFLDNGLSFSAG